MHSSPNQSLIKICLAGLIALTLWSLWAIVPAYANGIVVNTAADNTTDDGLCTLREAMINANDDAPTHDDCGAGSSADTITFSANYTITLGGSQLPLVTSTITISGNGAANTIIQANAISNTATYRVFEVDTTGDLSLNGLTVRNGRCTPACNGSGRRGGGIYNQGSLTITNSAIRDNVAELFGGGIFNTNSSPTLTDVTFDGNTAVSGGGLYNTNNSSPTLTDVTFDSNSSSNGGGGMHNDNSSPTLTDVTFSGNSSSNSGGGMHNDNSSPTLTGVIFNGNTAVLGGGMVNISSSPTLTNVTFSGNSSSSVGGGMVNNFSSSPTLTDVTFDGNSSNGGGGMYNAGSSSPTLIDVTFHGNSSSDFGGGLYNEDGSPMLTNVTFSNNMGGNGGGMYNSVSSPVLTNVTFSGNTVTELGGGMLNASSSPTLTNVTFGGNSADDSGGGLYNEDSSNPSLINVIIAASPGGGDCVNDASMLNAASSNNLIEDAANACGLTDGVDGNIIGSDPLLEPLADNGGSTQTMALDADSPAIDAGTNTGCPATDQRGVARPQENSCDIGAYEAQSGDTVYLPIVIKN